MRWNKSILISLLLMTLVAALYRIIPGRPYGFAPQWAIAVFAGAVIRDRKWAFIMPVISMFLSDLLFQVLYLKGMSAIPGFYDGQWQNYLLFALMAAFGMMIRKFRPLSIFLASLGAPSAYFILSNFVLWAGWSGTRGFGRPKTFGGLIQCYNDALPFYPASVAATVLFSAILFGTFYLIGRRSSTALARA
jgi:hypothetical protein